MRHGHSDRAERAILRVLKDHQGAPLTVKQVAKLAAKLGPDAPTIRPTMFRLVRDGRVAPTPGQRQAGVRFNDMTVTLNPPLS